MWMSLISRVRAARGAIIAGGLLAGLALSMAPPLRAQEANAPLLQLDPGGHTAAITGIAATADRRQILSAGYDKVIRVWDLVKGETVKMLRGDSGPNEFGQIYALAASPSTSIVAAGGYMAQTCPSAGCGDIRLFDYDSGKLVARLSGAHDNVVLGLAFSPNGQFLASVGGDSRVVIWDVNNRSAEGKFILPDGAKPTHVAFMPDNRRLVTGGRDGKVRFLDRVTLEIMREQEVPGGINALAASLDGKLVAAGGRGGRIYIMDGTSGDKLRDFDNKGNVAALAFGASETRHQLAASSSSSPFRITVWNADTGTAVAYYDGHDNTVRAVTFSQAGRQVYSAGGVDQSVHIWSPKDPGTKRIFKGDGAVVTSVGFIEATFAASPTSLQAEPGAAASGERKELYLAWGRSDPCPALQSCPDINGKLGFALRLPTSDNPKLGKPEELTRDQGLQRRQILSSSITASRVSEGERRLERIAEGGRQERFPKLTIKDPSSGTDAKVISERGDAKGNDHLSYSFASNKERVYSGGRNGVLEALSVRGEAAVPFAGHSGDVWSVVEAPGGQIVASGSADQTVRLWNADTGELIATLLYLTEDSWAMWTPQGYYTSSPQGDRLVGWQINRGPDEEAQFITARNMRKHFYKPDVVAQAILQASATAAVRELKLEKGFNLKDLNKHEKPKLRILSPRSETKMPAGMMKLKVDLSGNEEEPIERLTVWVNERKLADFAPPFALPFPVDVPIDLGRNTIRVLARNAEISAEASTDVVAEGGIPPPRKGALIIMAIGVNNYPNKSPVGAKGELMPVNLNYSVADARSMVETLGEKLKGGHATTETWLLVDGASKETAGSGVKLEPTTANIQRVLDRVRDMSQDDTLIIFIAGHGINLEQNEGYAFLPADARFGPKGLDSGFLIKWHDLETRLQIAKGRRFLFVDTCQSAGAVNGELIKPLADEEVVAFMAASREQLSWEFPNLGHGVFTSSVLQGLKGEADADGNHEITVRELGNYIFERVQDLTNGDQLPDSYRPRDGRDFVFARY